MKNECKLGAEYAPKTWTSNPGGYYEAMCNACKNAHGGKCAFKILSIDAETNGLWGQAFSIGAVLMEEGKETASFVARCPIEGEINPWVAENVLPQMAGIPETHTSYRDTLAAFVGFYLQHKQDAAVIVHMGFPVEAKLFLDAHAMGILGDWDAPYPLIDIAAFPEVNVSVDGYNQAHNIFVPSCEGGTHNPLYDSRAAALCYQNL